jgi:LEA14-like dessication related protein
MNRCLPAVFVMLVLMLLTGCGSVQRPSAEVRGAELGEITGDAITLNMDVLLSNPNRSALKMGRSSYAMTVADVRIVEGESEAGVTLPAGGSAPLTVPVRIRWDELLRVKDALVQTGGDVPYRIDGRIGIGGALPILGQQSIPLEYSGTLPLKQALSDPTVLLKSRAVRELAAKILTGLR